MASGIGNLPCRALSDVSARIDDEDLIRHVNLGEMHLVQHLLYPVLPDLIVSAVAEESDRYDNVSLKGLSYSALKRVLPQSVITLNFPCISYRIQTG